MDMVPNFTELPNLIPELVPQLMEAGDHTLASLYIDLNSRTREVYENNMDIMQAPEAINFDEMMLNLEESKLLLKDSLELMLMLIERHPDIALWLIKEMSFTELKALK